MTTADPYAVLGVPRTATREEIARAYRAVVKRSHPDTGAPTSPAEMARISAAWKILGDPMRRARWDREHAIVMETPAWTAPAIRPQSVRPATSDGPRSRMDSGPIVAAVVGGIGLVLVAVMVVITLVVGPPTQTVPFAADALTFDYPDSWSLTPGERPAGTDRWVVAHLTSFPTGADERCLIFSERCRWEADALPSGGASVQVIAWESGRPPEPEPNPEALIGGAPSAHAQATIGDEHLSAWWQLSPPGFPDRWIEVRAEIRGGDLERARRMAEIDDLLDSVAFSGS